MFSDDENDCKNEFEDEEWQDDGMLKEYISKLKVKRMIKNGKCKLQKTLRAHKKAMKKIETETERIKNEQERKIIQEKINKEIRKIEARENRKEPDNWGPKFFGSL